MIIKEVTQQRFFDLHQLTEQELKAIMYSLDECIRREIHNAYYMNICRRLHSELTDFTGRHIKQPNEA